VRFDEGESKTCTNLLRSLSTNQQVAALFVTLFGLLLLVSVVLWLLTSLRLDHRLTDHDSARPPGDHQSRFKQCEARAQLSGS
jgi:flagellar biogenesis protein FliO